MYVQGVDNVYDLNFNGREGDDKVTYGDVFLQAEQEYSRHNFEHADTAMLLRHFEDAEAECQALLDAGARPRGGDGGAHTMALPAYDQCIKASHVFNLLDARGVISVTERQSYIVRVREPGQGLRRGVPADRGRRRVYLPSRAASVAAKRRRGRDWSARCRAQHARASGTAIASKAHSAGSCRRRGSAATKADRRRPICGRRTPSRATIRLDIADEVATFRMTRARHQAASRRPSAGRTSALALTCSTADGDRIRRCRSDARRRARDIGAGTPSDAEHAGRADELRCVMPIITVGDRPMRCLRMPALCRRDAAQKRSHWDSSNCGRDSPGADVADPARDAAA